MGYFSNGTEGMRYEEEYCSRCIHGDKNGAGSCAVIAAHFVHNYKECNNKESILHMLIPRTEDGIFNDVCLMFVAREIYETDKTCTYCQSESTELKHEPWCKRGV